MILIGGVGYSDLRDLSFGPRIVERLRELEWPATVQVEDLSYGPMAVVQWLQDTPGRFDRAILVGAVERRREPGTLARYRWVASELGVDEVQACVAEAVTGVIGLDNLLVIGHWFGVLPAHTMVMELEPVDLEWGSELSAVAGARLIEALDWIRAEAGSMPVAAGDGHRHAGTLGSAAQ